MDLLGRFISGGTHSPEKHQETVELSLGLSLNGKFGVEPPKLAVGGDDLTRSSQFVGIPATDTVTPPLMRAWSMPAETVEWRKRKELQTLRRWDAKKRRVDKRKNVKGQSGQSSPLALPPVTATAVALTPEKFVSQGSVGSPGSGGSSGVSELESQPSQPFAGSKYLSSDQSATGPAEHALSSLGGKLLLGSNPKRPRKDNTITENFSSKTSRLLQTPSPGSGTKRPSKVDAIMEPTLSPGTDSGFAFGSGYGFGTKRSSKVNVIMEPNSENSSSNNDKTLKTLLANMPCAYTKGEGPDGKLIEGFLYRYNNGDTVRIMCVCHGLLLTPVQFVRHGGGSDSDVKHPLKHIVIRAPDLAERGGENGCLW